MFPGHEYCRNTSIAAVFQLDRAASFRRNMAQYVVRQQRNVFLPFVQRRNPNRNDRDPEKQVFAKTLLPHQFLQVAVGCRNQADVHRPVAHISQPPELVRLQHLEQLWLHRQVNVSDLVEKHRSAVGDLEQTGLGIARPR